MIRKVEKMSLRKKRKTEKKIEEKRNIPFSLFLNSQYLAYITHTFYTKHPSPPPQYIPQYPPTGSKEPMYGEFDAVFCCIFSA